MADSITKERINLLLPYSGLPVVLAAVLFTRFGQTDLFVVLWFMLVSVFGYVAATLDIRSKRIPNELVLAMAAAWVITITPKLLLDTAAGILLMKDSLFGFLVGGGLFLIVYMISRKGLGGGDVKFMAVTGLYLGFSGTL
jgi:leader peptidase (prepilin peptidase)/N-methyltransferase